MTGFDGNQSAAAAEDGAALQGLAEQLLTLGSDCIQLIDSSNAIAYINPAGLLALGKVAADVIGSPWLAQWPGQEAHAVSAALNLCRQTGASRFQSMTVSQAGQGRWWDVALTALQPTSNGTARIMAVMRDATPQRQAQLALESSAMRFRALADNIPQCAWIADPNGEIVWYNQRWFDYTGTTFDDVKGSGWMAVHHPDHLDRVVAAYRASIAAGTVWEDTFPLRGVDGTYRWFLSRAHPVRDPNDRIGWWCGTNTDITDERESGARLAQKARIIELSHEAILVWNFESGIQSWNRGCEEIYGYSREEAIGRRSEQLLRARYSVAEEEVQAELREHGSWTGEVLHFAKDGKEVWVDSRQQLINVGDRSVVLETNRDISERRRAEEVRRLLIGELHHRVKNTLAIVQSIATQTARHSTDIQQFISSFTARLHAISSVHNVLSDAYWEGAYLAQLIKSQALLAAGAGDRVRLEGENPFLTPQLATQLMLVFHELLSNAVKFGSLSQPQGKVKIISKSSTEHAGQLDIVWQEYAGPQVAPPTTQGFGLAFFKRTGNLPHMKIALNFDAEGLRCYIRVDLTAPGAEPSYFNPSFMSLQPLTT